MEQLKNIIQKQKEMICSGSHDSCPDFCKCKLSHCCDEMDCDPFWMPIRCGYVGAKHQFNMVECISQKLQKGII